MFECTYIIRQTKIGTYDNALGLKQECTRGIRIICKDFHHHHPHYLCLAGFIFVKENRRGFR